LQHTRRALDEDPQCALALAAEGFVHCHILRDLAGAEDRLARALELDPNESWAWLFRATVASFRGEGERAWEYASRARALSPVDPVAHYYDGLAASAAVAAERYREAIELAARSLRVNAAQLPTLRALVIAQVMTGELESARAGARRVCELDPQFRLRAYVDNAPAGGGEMRRRWADALGRAGIPYD
jgi:tetratricopeptide (TPR) repeat protein